MAAGQRLTESRLDELALRTAAEWDDGEGVLSRFGKGGRAASREDFERISAKLREALSEAEDRALGREDDPVWEEDCRRLRRALEIAERTVPEHDDAYVPGIGNPAIG